MNELDELNSVEIPRFTEEINNINDDKYLLACEKEAMFFEEPYKQLDKQLFVENLGILLSQTDCNIKRLWLDINDNVHIISKSIPEKCVNVYGKTYIEIVKIITNTIHV